MLPAVHQALRNAKKSIVVSMYVISVYPNTRETSPTFILLQDLIDAHERGVRVRVILGKQEATHRLRRGTHSPAMRGIQQRCKSGSRTALLGFGPDWR